MPRHGHPPALTKENGPAIARARAQASPRSTTAMARDAYETVEAVPVSGMDADASAGGSPARRISMVFATYLVADLSQDPRGMTQGLTQSRVAATAAAARATSACGYGTLRDIASAGVVRARARESGAAQVARARIGAHDSCGPEEGADLLIALPTALAHS